MDEVCLIWKNSLQFWVKKIEMSLGWPNATLIGVKINLQKSCLKNSHVLRTVLYYFFEGDTYFDRFWRFIQCEDYLLFFICTLVNHSSQLYVASFLAYLYAFLFLSSKKPGQSWENTLNLRLQLHFWIFSLFSMSQD